MSIIYYCLLSWFLSYALAGVHSRIQNHNILQTPSKSSWLVQKNTLSTFATCMNIDDKLTYHSTSNTVGMNQFT